MGLGLPGFAECIGHKVQIAPFGWKAQICTSRSHELNVDMHSFKNQPKRSSLGLFSSKLILLSLWRSGWEALPFTCHLSWLRKCLCCLEALTTCAGTVVDHFGPCLVWGRSSVWCTTSYWSGPGWLWLFGGTWQAEGLLWWPAVVSFNLWWSPSTSLTPALLQGLAMTTPPNRACVSISRWLRSSGEFLVMKVAAEV